MNKLLVSLTMFTMVALSSGCGGGESARTGSAPTPAPSNKLAILGSTSLLPVVQKAVDAFQKQHPNVTVSLTGGGSLIGINAFVDGASDIAMSSRGMTSEEKEKLRKKQRTTARETIVAWDGIVPIVHRSNPVKNLSLAELKDIYTGKVADWQQVGGRKGAIVVIARDFTSGTHEDWAGLVMNNEAVTASAQEKASSEAMLDMVASTPNAIGYDGIGYVEGNTKVKTLSVDGKAASESTILDKSYKIVRPLYLFSRENPTTAVVEFLNFMTSPEGQALVKQAKLVPIPPKGANQ